MKNPYRHGRHKRMFRMGAAGTTRRARRAGSGFVRLGTVLDVIGGNNGLFRWICRGPTWRWR